MIRFAFDFTQRPFSLIHRRRQAYRFGFFVPRLAYSIQPRRSGVPTRSILSGKRIVRRSRNLVACSEFCRASSCAGALFCGAIILSACLFCGAIILSACPFCRAIILSGKGFFSLILPLPDKIPSVCPTKPTRVFTGMAPGADVVPSRCALGHPAANEGGRHLSARWLTTRPALPWRRRDR